MKPILDGLEAVLKTLVAWLFSKPRTKIELDEAEIVLSNTKTIMDQVFPRPDYHEPVADLPMNRDMLSEFCIAISNYEGGPKDLNHRQCNPGNLKYGPFAIAAGATRQGSKGFAIFPSWDIGMNALEKLVRNAASGKSVSYKPTMTILQFFSTYAPSSDNNDPNAYAKYVGGRLRVDYKTYQIKNLL